MEDWNGAGTVLEPKQRCRQDCRSLHRARVVLNTIHMGRSKDPVRNRAKDTNGTAKPSEFGKTPSQ
jgi:hypothetical protein